MPEEGQPDPRTRRMLALRDADPDPFAQLGVATDYLRAVARPASRSANIDIRDAADAVVLLVATQIWEQAVNLLTGPRTELGESA